VLRVLKVKLEINLVMRNVDQDISGMIGGSALRATSKRLKLIH
jgi:hypothetical protein